MATVRGKQKPVAEGSFLQFLRSVGYKEELPPSTVAWLESAPVFKFLASRLGHDNFVSPDEQQEYNEISLARGPQAELYDALGSGSSDDEEDEAAAADDSRDADQDWMGKQPESHLLCAVQAKEAEVQQLEQQVAALKGLAGRLEQSVSEQRSRQAMYLTAQAHAAQQLAAAKAEASSLNTELNMVLKRFSQVCSGLASLLLDRPQQWLLSAADLSSYGQQDAAARELFLRAMAVLRAALVVRQLSQSMPATPLHSAAGSPSKLEAFKAGSLQMPATAAAAAKSQLKQAATAASGSDLISSSVSVNSSATTLAGGAALMMTPRQRKQSHSQQQQHMQQGLLEADARRHADQEAHNAALLRELTRQRLALKLGLDDLISAEMAAAGVKGQLAAAQHVKAGTGGFARYKRMGQASLDLLSAEVRELERCRQQLAVDELPALTEDLARLNDTHIVVGDYDRQLSKMSAARTRKLGVLRALLGASSRHLLLLLLTCQELQRLQGLEQQLSAAADQLDAHICSTRTRINRCIAAGHSLQQSQQRSNLKPDDTYLLALLAAADGSLSRTAEDQEAAAAAAATADKEPSTPLSAAVTAACTPPRSARTPSYLPLRALTDQLNGLSSSRSGATAGLQQLLRELPKQLETTREAARQLHLLAFPPDLQQALQAAAAAAAASGSSNTKHDVGGSSCAPSVATSVTSKRSTGSSTNTSSSAAPPSLLLLQHPLPVLQLPEVTEAQQSVEAHCSRLGQCTYQLVKCQNESVKLYHAHKADKDLERSVMSLFFSQPDELAAKVERLREEVAALELAAELQMGS